MATNNNNHASPRRQPRRTQNSSTPQLVQSDEANVSVKRKRPKQTDKLNDILVQNHNGAKKASMVKTETKAKSSSSPSPLKKKKIINGNKIKSPVSSSSSSKGTKYILYSNDIAQISPENKWIDLNVPPEELRPSATLTTGQCFNFIVVHSNTNKNKSDEYDDKINNVNKSAWGTHNETEWIGPIHDMVLSIKETKTTTLFRIVHSSSKEKQDEEIIVTFLKNYFQLETPLKPLYNKWSKNDPRLAKIAPCIPGVRIIRQDPIECLFSFICSSNNNIPRITKLLSSFRETYGQKLIDLPMRIIESADDHGMNKIMVKCEKVMSIYSFPTLHQLQPATEEELRGMGLGYRAKYIIQTRDLLISNGGSDHLLSLRSVNDPDKVQEELLQYPGIGRKVADCIALFSLDQRDAIPVDVHVQHIASRDYDASILGTAKSLTPTIYKKVGDLFRSRFNYSGWAHSLLFVAELPSFRDVLPEDVVLEMDIVSNIFRIIIFVNFSSSVPNLCLCLKSGKKKNQRRSKPIKRQR